jgi:hypothetical protein
MVEHQAFGAGIVPHQHVHRGVPGDRAAHKCTPDPGAPTLNAPLRADSGVLQRPDAGRTSAGSGECRRAYGVQSPPRMSVARDVSLGGLRLVGETGLFKDRAYFCFDLVEGFAQRVVSPSLLDRIIIECRLGSGSTKRQESRSFWAPCRALWDGTENRFSNRHHYVTIIPPMPLPRSRHLLPTLNRLSCQAKRETLGGAYRR